MLRLLLLFSAVTALPACAVFSTRSASIPQPARAQSQPLQTGATLRKVSLETTTQGAIARPVGLAPCAGADSPKTNCWRKRDRHVLFPEAPPDVIAVNAIDPAPIVDVKD